MAYDVTLVSVNATSGGFGVNGGLQGFPLTFNTLIYSEWLCGQSNRFGAVGIGPAFIPAVQMECSKGVLAIGSSPSLYSGTFPIPAPGVRHHFLLSFDTGRQLIQLYVDDQAVPVSGTWSGPPGTTPIEISTSSTFWNWDGEGVAVVGLYPGVGDIFCANRSGDAFTDLSVVANRRLFINADLSPVDLGNNASAPFGVPPQIYCSVRTGGVANDLLINRGSGGTNFTVTPGYSLSLQTPGTCSLPPPPPPTPPPAVGLQMADLIATDTQLVAASDKIYLDWSDDRGVSFGNPVSRHMVNGRYFESLLWRRLGYARDRVFRLTWSVPLDTSLQGAWIDLDATPTS